MSKFETGEPMRYDRVPIIVTEHERPTKSQLREQHGTPQQFEEASHRAYADGFIKWSEHQDAVFKYRLEYAEASDA